MTNREQFQCRLETEYARLFRTDPDYGYAAARTTPKQLAEKMALGLTTGNASKDGRGIRLTCKALGINYTYAAIRQYLTQ